VIRLDHSIDPRDCAACAQITEAAAAAAREDVARNEARIRAELRDRLDRCDPFAYEAALREAAHLNPDLITEALDATGAPT